MAAVDIGTNSVRLLVARRGADGLDTLQREMRITRLGQAVDAAGRLADEAVERTLEVLASFVEAWRDADAARVRITATSAVRDSANAGEFAAGVRRIAGVPPEVLTGEEEAALAFAGAVSGAHDHPAPFCVVDIGGGSTEVIRGVYRPEASTSRQLGSVRVTERCFRHDPPTGAEVADARAFIDAELEEVGRLVQPWLATTLIGTAGTVTTLAALHLDLPSYEPERIHGTVMPAAVVRQLADHLAAIPAAARAELGPMAPGREDVIAGGAEILARVVERFGFEEVVTSEADILDGLALSLLD